MNRLRMIAAQWERAFLAASLALLSLLELFPDWAWTIWGQMPADVKAYIPASVAPKIPVALFALAMLSRLVKWFREAGKPPDSK
jgi:hypothetical protein